MQNVMIRGTGGPLSALTRLTAAVRCDPQCSRFVTTDNRPTGGPTAVRSIQPIAAVGTKRSFPRPNPNGKGKGKEIEARHRGLKKNWTAEDDTTAESKRPLRPAILAGRIQKLCAEGKLDEAVDMVKAMPSDAQNAPVWNTLIKEAFLAQRSKRAYQLYVEMKRRGIVPTVRTYNTMFAGYSKLDDWSKHSKQLELVHSLWDNYIECVQATKLEDLDRPEFLWASMQWYIRILGVVGQYQKMFDVYNQLLDGPLYPNHFVYAAMFFALSKRAQHTGEEQREAAGVQNASDLKLLWRQMLKVAQKHPDFVFDSHLITAALALLSQGKPNDHLFAFDIIRDYLGLAKPGEEAPPAKLPLSHQLLSQVLLMCNVAQKYRLTVHYFSQVVERIAQKREDLSINHKHMDHVFRAYAGLSAIGSVSESSQALSTLQWMLQEDALRSDDLLQPGPRAFALVLIACWRGEDWKGAVRTFELMSGYNADDFKQSLDVSKPRKTERSKGRNLIPDPRVMSYFARTALATHDTENMKQCLRIIEHLGADRLLPIRHHGVDSDALGLVKDTAFFDAKMADVTWELVKTVMQDNKDHGLPLTDEHWRWLQLKAKAREVIKHNAGALKHVPDFEDQPLGSVRGLAATESVVDHAFLSRRT